MNAEFAIGFESFARILQNANADKLLDVFDKLAHEAADLWVPKGLDRDEAMTTLRDLGRDYEIGTAEAIDAAITKAFERNGNGHDAPAHGGTKPNAHGGGNLIQSSAQFVKGFIPPDYLIDGILQRRFLYSFTGKTGSGKTAIVLLFAASVALGRSIGPFEVTQGRVLYFAGENPDDVRMRWIAMAQQMDFDVDAIDVCFIPGRFKISALRPRILKEVQDTGDVVLVVVDTSAAYFEGDEANSNTQQIAHALMLRTLVGLPGGPCVIANCHPVKNATADNLIPYGGGGFLNEVDGNLTSLIENAAIEVHWQGKFRGPDFAPINFTVRTVTHEHLKDTKGRLIPTVVASHLSEIGQQELANVARSNEDKLLAEIGANGARSLTQFAVALGWYYKSGTANKTQAKRSADALLKAKLITRERDGFELTAKGRKALPKDGGRLV
jgi:hypothetical protein